MKRHVDDPVGRYVREAGAFGPLPAGEERRLAALARAGDGAARDLLARHNLRLAVSLAKRYAGEALGLDDLISEAVGGLMVAVDRFDPDRGCRFSTYAYHWITQGLRRAVARRSRVRERAASEVWGADRWREGLDNATGRPDEDVGVEDGIREGDPRLWAAVDSLPRRQRQAIVLRFGLGGGEPRTLDGIGAELGVSRERARQLVEQGLGKLRQRYGLVTDCL